MVIGFSQSRCTANGRDIAYKVAAALLNTFISGQHFKGTFCHYKYGYISFYMDRVSIIAVEMAMYLQL